MNRRFYQVSVLLQRFPQGSSDRSGVTNGTFHKTRVQLNDLFPDPPVHCNTEEKKIRHKFKVVLGLKQMNIRGRRGT